MAIALLFFDLFKWCNHIAFMLRFAWEQEAIKPSPFGPGLVYRLQ
jgi:hypothetical protein